MRILLVEDEADIATTVAKFLRGKNFEVDIAENLHFAWESVRSIDYPLVLLDRRLPDGDGVQLIVRSQHLQRVPRYLILSALGDVDQKVDGLNIGASDYMVKPFEPRELLARIQAMLRIPRPKDGGVVTVGNLSYDRGSRQFMVNEETIALRRRELEILEVLITRARQIVSREELFDSLYGFDEMPSANTLDSHISRLRNRLAETNSRVIIHTARNLGYLLREGDA